MAPAQRIFTGGKVITVDAAFSIKRAIAVTGEHILAVGSDAEIEALAGPRPNASISPNAP